jgi:hypothetical protein
MSKRVKRTSSRKKKNLGKYKSGLEKYCADKLAEYGIAFSYEEKTYELQEAFVYPSVYYKMTARGKDLLDKTNKTVLKIEYTPDFFGVDHNWIIETKGMNRTQYAFWIKWKIFLKHLLTLENPPAVFVPRTKQHVDETVEKISQLIKNGQI